MAEGLVGRLQTAVEDRVGLAVRPKALLDRLEENAVHLQQFRDEAGELAYHTLDYFGGRPQEMVAEKRRRLAQRSRIAFIQDPIAGAEALLLGNFTFGRGPGMPKAPDKAVQEVIEETWTDPNNVDTLFGFAAQRKLSNDLLTQANLFITAYVRGGKVRFSRLDADSIFEVMPDPEHRLRVLYYLGHRRTYKWDVQSDRPDFDQAMTEEGLPKVTYYRHWRNIELAESERKENDGMEPLPDIPEEKRDPGDALVYHVAINQLGEAHFGTPPWARTLRFYTAMNQFTESRVAMAQASASIIATRTIKGTPRDIVKSATSVIRQTGELGTARFGGEPFGTTAPADAQVPPGPGAWWVQNQQDKLESLNLSSGASAAVADSQIIRAPLAAASQFGQHYLGDASNANLATATTLELPTLMHVSSWQEIFRQMLRWATDLAIDVAVRAGRLGGAFDHEDGEKPISELRLYEAEDRGAMEKRTKKDLSYEFEMPYPGRRNLPDVSGTFTSALGIPGMAENEPMIGLMLGFLFTHGLQLDDPGGKVEEVMEAHKAILKVRAERAEQEHAMKLAAPEEGGPGQPPGRDKPVEDQRSTYGERRRGGPPNDEMSEQEWLAPELREPVAAHAHDTVALFDNTVTDVAVLSALSLTPPSENGAGA